MEYNNFCIEEGKINVILSAPHCVNHFRNGKIKKREINTDVLIKNIKKKIDISIIYKTESSNEDANYDEKSLYKEKLKEYVLENNIKLLLDIHGMDFSREEDICIGTAYGKNVCEREDILACVKNTFEKYNYKNVTVDYPFSANNPNCVSTFISRECNIPAFQIEINNKYRFGKCKEYDLDTLEKCFIDIIKNCI